MLCSRCGKQVTDGAKFCRYCGCQLETQPSQVTDDGKKRNGKKKGLALALLLGAVVILLALWKLPSLLSQGSFLGQASMRRDWEDDEIAEQVDVSFEEHGLTHPRDYVFPGEVIQTNVASRSKSALTMMQVREEFTSRGFNDPVIIASYAMSGEVINIDMDEDDGEPHPMYYGFYESPNGAIWSILVVDGQLMAIPFDASDAVELTDVVVEEDYLTVYNAYTDQFIRGVPDGSTMTIVTVNRLDASALDKLS